MACVEAVAETVRTQTPAWQQTQGVLLVSTGRTDADVVRRLIDESITPLTVVRSYREAMTALTKDTFALILCDERLPDGSWKDVVGQIAFLPEAPRLAVLTTDASESLYAEVLNLGGWELLLRPIQADEANRLIEVATLPRKSQAARASGR